MGEIIRRAGSCWHFSGGLAQGMLGKELGLDASLARANSQPHQQPPPQLAEWPRDQSMGRGIGQGIRFPELDLVEPALVRGGTGTQSFHEGGIHSPRCKNANNVAPRKLCSCWPGDADLEVDQTRLALAHSRGCSRACAGRRRRSSVHASPGAGNAAPGKTIRSHSRDCRADGPRCISGRPRCGASDLLPQHDDTWPASVRQPLQIGQALHREVWISCRAIRRPSQPIEIPSTGGLADAA